MAVKLTCSAGKTDCGQENVSHLVGSQTGYKKERKQESNGRKKELGHGGNPKDPQDNLLRAISRVNHCGLFNSRLTEIMIGLMYVLSTRPNVLLRDCSLLAPTTRRPFKRQVCEMIESHHTGTIEIGYKC